jgi:delta-aminolevulinic acid dehydratase/porphobilinogen synthase
MREMELDLEEGADMLMVKPAMPYWTSWRSHARGSMFRWPPTRFPASFR